MLKDLVVRRDFKGVKKERVLENLNFESRREIVYEKEGNWGGSWRGVGRILEKENSYVYV